MCQTQGIRQAAQVEVLLGWHNLQDRRPDELRPAKRLRRALDRVLLRRAYERAVQQNPALERLFGQERDQAVVQMNLNAKNYNLAAEPMSNVYGALYSTLATDDPGQRKRMRYIGSCVGRIFYLLEKAGRVVDDKRSGRTATCRKGTTLKLFSRSVSASESCASIWGDSCTRISSSGP